MKLEIPLTEIENFLANRYNTNISLKSIDKNKIEVNYIIPIVLSIKEVNCHELFFKYEVGFLGRIGLSLLEEKIKKYPILLDRENHEITIDLRKIDKIKEYFKYLSLSELQFINDEILLVLKS